MTRDDILRMAREAGFEQVMRHKDGSSTVLPTAIFERFAALVAAAEREECALLVEDKCAYTGGHGEPGTPSGLELSAAIRARGTK